MQYFLTSLLLFFSSYSLYNNNTIDAMSRIWAAVFAAQYIKGLQMQLMKIYTFKACVKPNRVLFDGEEDMSLWWKGF